MSEIFDQRVKLVNEKTGEPLKDVFFCFVKDGIIYSSGYTSSDGLTPRIITETSESFDFYVGDDALRIVQGDENV